MPLLGARTRANGPKQLEERNLPKRGRAAEEQSFARERAGLPAALRHVMTVMKR